MEVDAVRVMVLKSPVELFAVHAEGKVPTTGWSNPALQPVIYITPPLDGMWDFQFVATAPAGGAGDVILPITANTVLPMPKWLKGVRVHAKNNSMEAKIGPAIPYVEEYVEKKEKK
jgi:hypothetical protein